MMDYIKKIVKLGAPLMAGMLVEYVMYIADSVMVGQLGTIHLAAVALGGLVAEILWAFTWTVAPAIQTYASRFYGVEVAEEAASTGETSSPEHAASRDSLVSCRRDTAATMENGVFFALTAGMASVLLSLAAEPVLRALIRDGAAVTLAMEYVAVIRWTMPGTALFFCFYGFLAGTGRTKVIMFAIVSTNILNILLNYLLIYGKAGFPAMGITGAALGTLLAQYTGLFLLGGVIVFSRALKKYTFFHSFTFSPALLKGFARVWSPITLQNIAAFCIFLVFEGFVSRYGPAQLAVIHIIFVTVWAGKTVIGGLSEGGSILIGNHLGRSEELEARRYAHGCLLLGGFMGSIMFLLAFFFPGVIVMAFNPESEVLLAGKTAVRFFSFFFFISTTGYALEVIFTHNGWSGFVFSVDLVSQLLFTLGFPLLLLQTGKPSIAKIWLGFSLYLLIFNLLLTAGLLSRGWLKKRFNFY